MVVFSHASPAWDSPGHCVTFAGRLAETPQAQICLVMTGLRPRSKDYGYHHR